jgi:hypothetical protein
MHLYKTINCFSKRLLIPILNLMMNIYNGSIKSKLSQNYLKTLEYFQTKRYKIEAKSRNFKVSWMNSQVVLKYMNLKINTNY